MPKTPPDEVKLGTGETGGGLAQPDDETRLRTGAVKPSALHPTSHAAAADGPRPQFPEIPAALAPAPKRQRGRGGLIPLLLAVLAAVAVAVWFFFFR